MLSTFTGIEIGKRGMMANNQGLLVIGHNLSNMATDGYSRQRIEISTMEPLFAPQLNREHTPGQIGQGPLISQISRVRDELLDERIVAQQGNVGYWSTRDRYIRQLEQIHNEPQEISLRARMDQFWDSWQELSLHPSETAPREAIVRRGQSMIESIHNRYQRLSATREMVEQDIGIATDQVNTLTRQIAALSDEIVKVKAMGDNPNDLLDRRDLLVDRLGTMIPIRTDRRDVDEFMIHIDGQVLVQGGIARQFELTSGAENDGLARINWQDTGDQAFINGGSLGALFELRDVDIREELASLDTITLTFTDLVNEVHRAGYGLNGKTNIDFFTELPSVNNIAGNYDRDGDGEYDASYIHRITGGNRLDAQEQIGLAGVISLSGPQGNIAIEYRPTDTVGDLVRRINFSGAEVTARLTTDGQLQLRATTSADAANPDFVIRHVEDSGSFLAGYSGVLNQSGPAGAFTWTQADAILSLRDGGTDFAVAPLAHPAGWIEVAPAVSTDLTSVAAGFGLNGRPAEAGDGSLALAIANLRTANVMVGSEGSFDDYYADAIADIGLKGEQSGLMLETNDRIAKSLTDTRASISGVNMDEELANMIKFQHGYAAAAKFIQHFDEMLDTIINRMGV
ncbi:MAG: flagellar hook-associated protein FlgK [Spirochaetes bacterium GWD1_61_31]|nr:MAG: flagellar hook-associated protein FlgK [Spirochaetes bacterium GWB1_60_80]OHD29477.1 MAG: flagellar hook-associated protein FlgK [Spirochaetes bacterium GWC1_61_12]OHD43997.1 MAG: flagellar hook-associated protein FlgK [Spirochaetes bacterium GWD1_61_31]OHD46191.1 MAG: flagellar hook-associated protein FlgK [Spirochaetes bacterium GWE1_60_18]OHD60729.1 MAG: flagellar hook-associated protein FlgK [Spirochaetes bacterium GWF1_60_12]HAP43880.1 flagellar hook-associated protein FlgK [Spiro